MKDSHFCMCVSNVEVYAGGVFVDRYMRLVLVLTSDERCLVIQITYGFLLLWLDTVITARMGGGGAFSDACDSKVLAAWLS